MAEYGNVHPRTDASPRYEEASESVAPQATPFVEQRTGLLAEGVVHNAVPYAWPRRLNAGAVLDAAGLPRHREDYAAAARREWPQVARLVVVAGVAWQVCVWLGADYPPVLAVIVPLVSLRDDPFSAFNFSIARLVGVVAGVVAGICVLQLLRPGVLAVVLVLGLSLVIGIVLRVGDVLNIQVAVSALLVFSSADPESYGLTRLWETGVGAVVTIVLAPLLFPANPLTAARAELQAIAARLTAAVRDTVRLTGAGELAVGSRTRGLVAVLHNGDPVAANVDRLRRQIATAQKSARWSLLRRRELRAVAGLDDTTVLAQHLSLDSRAFAEESITFALRAPQYASDPHLRPDRLERVSEPLIEAIPAALEGAPFEAAVARATAAVAEFHSSEHSHLASVVRRPLHRMVEDLQSFVG